LFKDEEAQKILEYGDMFIDEHFDAGSGLDKFEIKVYLGMNLWDLSLQLKSFEEALNFQRARQKLFFPHKFNGKDIKL